MAEKNQNGTTIIPDVTTESPESATANKADTLGVKVEEPSNSEQVDLDNLKKFQKLLAYFVWHLEYNNARLETAQFFCGTEKTMGSRTGQGYNTDSIQDAIKDWEILTGGRVFITVVTGQNSTKGFYATENSYLHWAGFAGNVSIYAKWSDGLCNDGKYHITDLYIKNKKTN